MRSRRGTVLILLGVLLIVGAAVLTGYNLWTDHRGEAQSGEAIQALSGLIPDVKDALAAKEEADEAQTEAEANEVPPWVTDPDRELPTAEIDGRKYVGTLTIPAVELELPVAANWDEDTLKVSVCRYAGTPYKGNLVICGHNYRSHFGPLARLPVGSEVIFTDMEGYAFRYIAKSVEVLQPTAVQEMEESAYPLSLFTCTLGGKTRLTVRCVSAEAPAV